MELSTYHNGILIAAGINILLGVSVFVMLQTGQFSLGTAGFMAIGAYAASILTVAFSWDLNLALIAGAILASGVGVLVAFPSLRLEMFHFALATFAFAELIRIFFINYKFTGGPAGFVGFMGLKGMSGTTLPLTAVWAVVILVALWRLQRSRLGRAFQGVAQDWIVAEGVGLNVTLTKVVAFAISGFVGGIAGGLFAHDASYVTPDQFTVMPSLIALLIVILGGREVLWGVILGAAIFAVLPEALRFMGEWRMAAYGAIFVLVLIFRPTGLLTHGMFRFIGRKKKGAMSGELAVEGADLETVA